MVPNPAKINGGVITNLSWDADGHSEFDWDIAREDMG